MLLFRPRNSNKSFNLQTIMYTRQKTTHMCCLHISVTRLTLVLIYIFNSYFELLLVHRCSGLRSTINKVLP